MAVTDAKVQIGASSDYLEGTSVTTPAGATLFREGVVLSDPETAAARAAVVNVQPGGSVYGPAVWVQGSVAVTGTFWQATQPVSGTVAATQSGTWNIGTVATITNPVAVTGTFWQSTQPISATSLPLPTLAATSTNQATEIASLSSIDGKIVAVNTGAVVVASGSITANAGSNLNTSLLATEAGNLASIKTKTDNLDVALSTRLKAADTLAGVTTVAAVTSITNPVTVTNAVLTDVWNSVTHVINTRDSVLANAYDAVNQRIIVDGSQVTQPVSSTTLATEATVAKLPIVQGTTFLTTHAGPMVQALVSDGRPTVTDGTLAPLSMNAEGRLRVSSEPLYVDFFASSTPSLVAAPAFSSNPW